MSIIKCPKCNENISNTVDQCVHCGSEITVCPECESSYVGCVNVCPLCGFVIKNNSSVSKTINGDEIDLKKMNAVEIKQQWTKETFSVLVYEKVGWIISGLLFIGSIILLFNALNQASKWGIGAGETNGTTLDQLEKALSALLTADSTLFKVKTKILISLILLVAHGIFAFIWNQYELTSFTTWLKNRNLTIEDFKKSFNKDLNSLSADDIYSLKSDQEFFCKAMLFSENPDVKKSIIKTKMPSFAAPLLVIIFYLNAEVIMLTSKVRFMSCDFLAFEHKWLIIVLIVLFVIDTRIEKKHRKIVKEEIKKISKQCGVFESKQ